MFVDVDGVAVTVVHVIDMVAVRHGRMPAIPTVGMPSVVLRGDMHVDQTLVPMPAVRVVGVPVMQVVGVPAVRDDGVPAAGAVCMVVACMNLMGDSHDPRPLLLSASRRHVVKYALIRMLAPLRIRSLPTDADRHVGRILALRNVHVYESCGPAGLAITGQFDRSSTSRRPAT